MPVPQTMLDDLESAEYRPVTLKSFNDFIGEVRYVSIETSGSDILVRQYLPSDPRSNWSCFTWTLDIYRYVAVTSRSNLSDSGVGQAIIDSSEWFAKMADKIDAWPGRYSLLTSREPYPATFKRFITGEYGGSQCLKLSAGVFNKKHPVDPIARSQRAIDLAQAELAAREARIKLQEDFAEVNELKMIGAQFSTRDDYTMASRYYQEAERLRARVQAALDRGETVVRENIAQSLNLPAAPGFADVDGVEFADRADSRRINNRRPASKPALPTVETLQDRKRSILLDDEKI